MYWMMKRMMHIISMAVMLLAALPVISCHHSDLIEVAQGELSVSLYIPDIMATKAETGSVGALESEKIFSSLQLWVFVSGGASDGQLVGYKGFTSAQETTSSVRPLNNLFEIEGLQEDWKIKYSLKSVEPAEMKTDDSSIQLEKKGKASVSS